MWENSYIKVLKTAKKHDYIYEDEPSENGKNVWADAAGRQRKLDRFKEIWQMPSLSYVKEAGGCRLFYLSPESLEKYSVALSQQQLAWLRQELAKAPQKPAIVFFHGILSGNWCKPYPAPTDGYPGWGQCGGGRGTGKF